MAAFRAYFSHGLNLAKVPVLLALAGGVGLPIKEAERILSDRVYQDKVDKDWADSRFKAVNAVPTFIMGRHKLIGAQSYEALEDLVIHYGVTKRQVTRQTNRDNRNKRKDEDS
jgi:predicted DsbA family dithiol-disulfide isomerase